MPKCKKCSNNAVNKVVTCQTCGLIFHEGCLGRYIGSKASKQCCKAAYHNATKGTSANKPGPSNNNSNERDTRFDSGRNINNESLLNISDLSNSTIVSAISEQLAPPAVNADSASLYSRTEPNTTMAAALPLNWSTMSIDDKLAEVLFRVSTGIQKTEDLSVKIDTLTVKVEDQAKYITDLETENESQRTEIAGLKARLTRVYRPEIKVTGIPRPLQGTLADVTRTLFKKLGIENELNDIFDIRELKPKPPQLSQASNTQARAADQSQSITFVIEFKSVCIRNKVLKAKRSRGILKFGELYRNGGNAIINMYEMLSPYAHSLRLAAKSRARENGYKFVWSRDDIILVRKDEDAEINSIVTDNDLDRII